MKKWNVKILCVCLLGAIHLLGASSSSAGSVSMDTRKNAFSLAWRAGLFGENSEDLQSSNKFVGFRLDARMNYWLAPTIFMNLDPKIKFESGSFQSIDAERKNETGIYLREAGAHWIFTNSSSLSAGALGQASSHSDLLVADQAFPAVRLRWQVLEVNNFYTGLEAKQAVPTSTSLSANTTGVEATPGFTTASLSFNYQPQLQYFWKNRIGSFRYENLPSTIAYESSFRGNTTTLLTPTEGQFIYQYEGLEASSELRFPVMRGWDLFGEASYLQNSKAPEKYNRAHAAMVGSEFFLIGQKSLDLRLTGFRIEPDAAVAYFNSPKYFFTNRAGYNLESFVNFKKYGFRVGLSYTEAELIYLNPVQSREKNWMIKLETFYANI